MSDYSGDDLLAVFSKINVKVNPNFARGLFDTDDKNMKKLLSWLCTSITSENYIPPLEEQEYYNLEEHLTGQKYEEEIQRLQSNHKGIFDIEDNTLDIELLQDEIDILLEEERNLDDLLRMEETLHGNLAQELNMQTAALVKTASKLKSTQDRCNNLAEELESVNDQIHTQIVKYAGHLNDFEFSSVPYFINNMDIGQFESKFDTLPALLGPILEAPVMPQSSLCNLTAASSFNMTNLSETVNNDLLTLRERILCSQQNYMITKIEIKKYNEILNYIDRINIEDILYLREDEELQYNIESKEEASKSMCSMLNKIATKFADEKIAATKLKYLQREHIMHQTKLDTLSEICNMVVKLLSLYITLSIIYRLEKKDVKSSDNFFRTICKETALANARTEKMNKIIEEYGKQTDEDKLKLVKTISKMLVGEDNTLDGAFAAIVEFKAESKSLEEKLFNLKFTDYRSSTDDLRDNIDLLQKFLVCGPTHRVVLIPIDLHSLILNVEKMLKKQKAAVKSAFDISASMKKSTNEWQNYRRQLWMYFYADPQKIDFILKKIENEAAKLKHKGI